MKIHKIEIQIARPDEDDFDVDGLLETLEFDLRENTATQDNYCRIQTKYLGDTTVEYPDPTDDGLAIDLWIDKAIEVMN